MRLSFCLPYIEYPSIEPRFDDEVIKNMTVSVVENRPEAPWIKWNSQGVVFTQDMLIEEEKFIQTYKDIIESSPINLKIP